MGGLGLEAIGTGSCQFLQCFDTKCLGCGAVVVEKTYCRCTVHIIYQVALYYAWLYSSLSCESMCIGPAERARDKRACNLPLHAIWWIIVASWGDG